VILHFLARIAIKAAAQGIGGVRKQPRRIAPGPERGSAEPRKARSGRNSGRMRPNSEFKCKVAVSRPDGYLNSNPKRPFSHFFLKNFTPD
jgi:hypothetical protein